MQKLLNKCEEYGRNYGLSFNPDKSEAVIFGAKIRETKLYLNNKPKPFHNNARHLGHVVSNAKNDLSNCCSMINDL